MDLMNGKPDNYWDLAIVDPDYGLDSKISQGGSWAAKYKNHDGTLGGKPDSLYFEELVRVSNNQIIWGGNYFNLPETRCFLIWDKVAHMDTLADCEFAWTSFDKNAKIFKHVRNTSEKRIHITQKPIALYKWILNKYGKEGNRILDTHGGSMSHAIACYDLGFDLDIIELDKDYFESGRDRVNNHIKKCEEIKKYGYAKTEIEKINPTLF